MPAAAVVGGSIVGGLIAADGSRHAANQQADAARNATDAQMAMYDQTRADQAPYRDAGYTALNQLGAGTVPGGEFNRNFTMADFQADPGYYFRQQQGQQAIQNSAAAGSGALSGATLKGLLRFGQDNASQEYMNAYDRYNNNNTMRFNRLASLAGLGQTSVGQTGAISAYYGGQIGNNITGAGNASAAGTIGAANALSGGLNNALGYYQFNRMNNTGGTPYQDLTYNGTVLGGTAADPAYG